jgi:hypothetical protein
MKKSEKKVATSATFFATLEIAEKWGCSHVLCLRFTSQLGINVLNVYFHCLFYGNKVRMDKNIYFQINV